MTNEELTEGRRFTGKTVIVTGGASGIGLAMTERFACEGAAVFVADVGKSDEWSDMLERGGDITFVDTDVTKPADWASLVGAASERNGGVDVLLNNAGLTRAGLLHEMSRENWDLVLNVDLNAVFHGAQAVLPGMVERGSGTVVNTASTLGFMANHHLGAYTAAKHGVVGLTKQIALDYGPLGVRCNAIAPGPTETPNVVRSYGSADAMAPRGKYLLDSVPIGRLGRPSEIASVAAFLASEEASFVNGAILPVDGGHSVHTGPIWSDREYHN